MGHFGKCPLCDDFPQTTLDLLFFLLRKIFDTLFQWLDFLIKRELEKWKIKIFTLILLIKGKNVESERGKSIAIALLISMFFHSYLSFLLLKETKTIERVFEP